MIFFKVVPRPLGMPKQVFLAGFEPLVAHYSVTGHAKYQSALKMGSSGTKNGSQMGQKHIFANVIPEHMACSNKCFLPILRPF